MRYLTTIALGLLLLAGGTGMMGEASANPSREGYGGGMRHSMHGHDKPWMEGLTDEQRNQLDVLHLEYKKKKYLLEAQMKQAKIELALLITADSPNKNGISKKIDEIVKLKGEKLRLKADHKIDVRKVLNPDQRVIFDLHVLKKAHYGKHHRCAH